MLEFRLLGPTEVRRDGELMEIGARKVRELLAVLLLADGRVVSDDRIIGALWGDTPPKNAKGSLHVSVFQLRSRLDDDAHSLVERTDRGYRLNTADASVDIRTFDRLVRDGLELLASGQPRPALQAFEEALGMAADEPLSDFATAEFARAPLDYIAQQRRSALEGRLEARLALGSHRQVIAEARPLLHEDPFNEGIWATLMLALYRSHRRTEALRTYQVAVAELAEAGLEPTERLTALESEILAQDESLLASSQPPPSNLPDSVSPRADDADTARLAGDLEAEPALTLVGSPSLTRAAAIETARLVQARFVDGVWLADLEHRSGSHLVARSVLDALGIMAGPRPEVTLADYLRHRSVLLVVTGAGSVANEVAWLASCLRSESPRSRLLITTTEPPSHPIGPVRSIGRNEATDLTAADGTEGDVALARMQVFGGPVTLEAVKRVVAFPPLDDVNIDYLLGRLVAENRVVVDNTGPVTRFSPTVRLGLDGTPTDIAVTIQRHADHCAALAERMLGGLDGPGRRDLLAAARAEHEELRIAVEHASAAGRLDTALRIGHAAGRYWSSQGSHLGQAITVLGPLVDRRSPASTDAAGVHLGLGFAHFRSGAYRRSATHYDRAVEIALDQGEPALAGRALAERGHLRMFLGEHSAAKADLEEAGRLADVVGSAGLTARTLMLSAQLGMRSDGTSGRLEQHDELDAAIQIYERLGHATGLANSLLVKSSWYIDTDAPGEAVDAAERALEIVQLGDDRSMLAFALVRSAESLIVAEQRGDGQRRALEAVAVSVDVGNWLVAGLALLSVGCSAVADSPPDVELAVDAFNAIREDLGVALTPREWAWAEEYRIRRQETATDGTPVALSTSEAKDVAFRLATVASR